MNRKFCRSVLSALLTFFMLIPQNTAVFAEETPETVLEGDQETEVVEENQAAETEASETTVSETEEETMISENVEQEESVIEEEANELEEDIEQSLSGTGTGDSVTSDSAEANLVSVEEPQKNEEQETDGDLGETAEVSETAEEEVSAAEEEEHVVEEEKTTSETEETVVEEKKSTDTEEETVLLSYDEVTLSGQNLEDSDVLLEQYLNQAVYSKQAVSNITLNAARKETLSETGTAVYSYLLDKATAIAGGNLASSEFTDTETLLSSFKTVYTAEELGVEAIIVNGEISEDAKTAFKTVVMQYINEGLNALMLDYPYELYWYDKTTGMTTGYSYSASETALTLSNLTIKMYVSSDYSATGSTNTTDVDTSKTSTASATASAAQTVVDAAATLSDYEKLTYYKEWICDAVDYNHDAADDSTTLYGDPWQIIYVFDGDSSTSVVCEGYSKAFKYLCDLTDFNSSAVSAMTVTGNMDGGTGAGAHMWNLVTMEDGNNYMVDVTNCDSGSIGAPDYLFMKAPVSYQENGYTMNCQGSSVLYTYDEDTLEDYASNELAVYTSDYSETETETVAVTGITVSPSEISLSYLSDYTLTATVLPENASNKNVSWTSSNANVAYVDENGNVTGYEPGTAIITVQTEDGGYTAETTVNVIADENIVTFSTDKNIYVKVSEPAYYVAYINYEGDFIYTLDAEYFSYDFNIDLSEYIPQYSGDYTVYVTYGSTAAEAVNMEKTDGYVSNTIYFEGETERIKLAAPTNLMWEKDIISWDSVDNAKEYFINYINVETNVAEESSSIYYGSSSERCNISIPDSVLNNRDHAWKFSICAKNSDVSAYFTSEKVYSEEVTFTDRQFSMDDAYVYVSEHDVMSDPISFTYTAEGNTGNPNELSFECDDSALTFEIYDDNTFSVSANKDGNYTVFVRYGNQCLYQFTVHVNAEWLSAYLEKNTSVLRVGKEYTFPVSYTAYGSSSGTVDYSELRFEVEKGYEDTAGIFYSADEKTLKIQTLKEGYFSINIYSDRYVGRLNYEGFEVKCAVPSTGYYLEASLSETENIYTYISDGYGVEIYWYADGEEQNNEDLTFTFSNSSVAEMTSADEWYDPYVYFNILDYGETDLVISANGTVLGTYPITVEKPDAYAVNVFRSQFTMQPGDTEKLLYSFEPEVCKPVNSVTPSTNDENVAVIDENGTITAIGAGSTTVYLQLIMPNGDDFTISGEVLVSEDDEIIGDGDVYPYVNAASISPTGTDPNEFKVTFADGYPINVSLDNVSMSLYLANEMFPGGFDLFSVNCTTDGTALFFDELAIRQKLDADETIPAGEYEVKMDLTSNSNEIYYLGKVTLERQITNCVPDDLTVEATDDEHAILISCGDNEACDVYLNAIYENRYIEGVTSTEQDWTKIGLVNSNGVEKIIAEYGMNCEYLIPGYSETTGRMTSLKISQEVMDKYGFTENDYDIVIYSVDAGYNIARDNWIHLVPSDEALALIPQNMSWNRNAVFSFSLPYGTWYSIWLRNYDGTWLWNDMNVVSNEYGITSYDFAYLVETGNTYYVRIRSSASEEDLQYASSSYQSYYYMVSGYQVLDTPCNLQFNDDGSISWDAVENAVKYYVVLYHSEADGAVEELIINETTAEFDWDTLNEQVSSSEDGYWYFTVTAVGDQVSWTNSSPAECTENSPKPVSAEPLKVTVNLDGEEYDGITNILFKRTDRQEVRLASVSASDNSLDEMTFDTAGEFTYQIYLASDNASVVPNYDIYTATYEVTEENQVLTVSSPVIRDNDGQETSKIVFDLMTPKPAVFAPEATVTLNGQSVTEAGLFTIKLKDDEGYVIQEVQNDASGKVTFDNIEGLNDALTYYYHIEADEPDGYLNDSLVRHITIVNDDYEDDGTFKPTVTYLSENNNVVDELLFNYVTKDYVVTSDALKLELTEDGTDPENVFYYLRQNVNEADDFEYILCSGKETETEILFTAPGVYEYQFSVPADNSGMKYGYEVYNAAYTVEENNGKLNITETVLTDQDGNEVTSFSYAVTSKTPAVFTPSVKVKLDGETPADGLFTFVLKDDEGIVVDDVKVNSGENIDFADLEFNKLTFTDIGYYYFTINQQGEDGRYILDKTVYHIAVYVYADNDSLVVMNSYYDYTENGDDYTKVDEPVFENTTPDSIPLVSISLNEEEFNLQKGENHSLTVSYVPDYTTDDKTITWSSSNENVATVDSTGTVTAVGAGNAVITAETATGQTASANVTVLVTVTSVSLNKTELAIAKGKTETLTATALPEDTTDDKTVTWSSSDESVATVDETGLVTAVNVGTATIKAVSNANAELFAECKVTVTIPAEKIEIEADKTELVKGEAITITAKVTPEDTTDDTAITWTSSDSTVATVDSNGVITAIGGGEAVIKAEIPAGLYEEISITVTVPITSIELDQTELTIEKGDTETLTATAKPEDTTDEKTFTWTSSDENVATVDSTGTVTAVGAGNAVITAVSTVNNEVKAECQVAVLSPIESIAIDQNPVGVKEGENVKVTVTILPEDTTDDKTVSWSTENEKVASVDSEGNVTGIGMGTTTITATASNGLKSEATVMVTVDETVNTAVNNSETLAEEIQETEDTAQILVSYSEETSTVDKSVFEAIEGTEKTVTLQNDGVQWVFNGSDIVNDASEEGVDLSIQVDILEDVASETENEGITEQAEVEEKPVLVVTFADNGELPGAATIRIRLSEEQKTYVGSRGLKVYYYNSTTDTMEEIADEVTVINDEYIEFTITHCSKYVVVGPTEADRQAAKEVEDMIAALPAVEQLTAEDEDAVQNARTAFSNLTAEQQKLVSNEDVLKNAEERVEKLVEDAAAAKEVIDMIAALPAVEQLTAEDEAAVQNARSAYDSLTEDQKELVTNEDVLKAAEEMIHDLMYPVERIYGSNRYFTSLEAADYLKEKLGVDQFSTIVLTTGDGFADALAGSYLANRNNAPVILINEKDKNKNAVTDYINKNLAVGGTIYVLGGTNAVPQEWLSGISGYNIERLAGNNRYGTNIQILEETGFSGGEILVCTGKSLNADGVDMAYADSLSASAVDMPILLVDKNKGLSEEQIEYLKKFNQNLKFYIVGGESAVPKEIEVTLGYYGRIEDRLAGANRYETSKMIAEKFFTAPEKAVIAYGENFPDGLSGGSIAYQLGAPLLISQTENQKKRGYAVEYCQTNGITRGIVLGGSSLVSDESMNLIFSIE